MEPILLNSRTFRRAEHYRRCCEALRRYGDKLCAIILSSFFIYSKSYPVQAAQTDKIITVVTALTQDLYMDAVFLSLGFCTTVCVFHLICIVFQSGDERGRSKHVKAIITAVVAWMAINLFAFLIAKIFNLTGANTPSDIFNAGGYGG